MDRSSQTHAEALTKALTECFLVDSRVHLSSLRRMAAMCYELRFWENVGLARDVFPILWSRRIHMFFEGIAK